MALTRKLLKGLGLSEEQIDSIIDAHSETVDALKGQASALTAKVTEMEGAQSELSTLKAGDYKTKYEAVKRELDDLKASTASKEQRAKLEAAYRARLEAAGIDPKRHDAILRVTDLSALKLDGDGKLEDAASVDTKIADEWGAFKVSTGVKGETVATPPATGKATMTKDEILAIRDVDARQAAIAENHELFGF